MDKIEEYVSLNKEMTELRKKVKELKEKLNEMEPDIMTYMGALDVDSIVYKNANIVLYTKKSSVKPKRDDIKQRMHTQVGKKGY